MTELEHVVSLISGFISRHEDLFIVFGFLGVVTMISLMVIISFLSVFMTTRSQYRAR